MKNPEFELKVDADGSIRESANDVIVCNGKEMRIRYYTNRQKILLVGEGDFSFAACLARAFCCASNLTATSLDSRGTVICKYSRGKQNLQTLKEHGATVIHQVDAYTMNKHPKLKNKLFDRIVFNFPHSGLNSGKTGREHYSWTIESHQCLVAGSFETAVRMVDKNGEIHVTHKTADPFDKWGIEKLAEDAGLMLMKKKRYRGCEYPGYINKKAYGKCWDATFPVGECSTFMFTIKGDAAEYDSDDAELSDATLMAIDYYEMADKRKVRK